MEEQNGRIVNVHHATGEGVCTGRGRDELSADKVPEELAVEDSPEAGPHSVYHVTIN